MNFNNKIMLITYPDSIGKNLSELKEIVDRYYSGAVGGIHILPFFPSSADRGFAPMTYREVSPEFGDWEDIKALSENYYLMFDYMINHISAKSEYFKDFLKNKDNSQYKDLFIRYKNFWPGGEATAEQLDKVYKRKERPPYIEATFDDGSKEKIWCTFDEEQIDLNLDAPSTKEFVKNDLEFLADKGAGIIRLDALAYATKEIGTDCFFVEPRIWNILDDCKKVLAPKNVELLPEIHEHYKYQFKLSEHDSWVYDFALPVLTLYSLYSGKKDRLVNWLNICPRKQFTTLDTHDGIGIVDVKDLMSDEEIEYTKNYLFDNGANIKRSYNTAAYNNLDIYQVNCTYYSALGDNDAAYLLARAIQFFAPGVPMVYYVGLFAGSNDIELLEETKVGRNINRHYYTKDEAINEQNRPVVARLKKLMEFRNNCDAFKGDIKITDTGADNLLEITWKNGESFATLNADLSTKVFTVTYGDNGEAAKTLDLN